MAANKKNEFEDLMKQIQDLPDNHDEEFDEEAEKQNIKMRLAKEEMELGQMEKNLKNIAGQVGVQYEEVDIQPQYGLGSGAQKNVAGSKQQVVQKQGQPQQSNKKSATDDLMAMINNMNNVDENEDFDEAQHKKNLAMYKEDEKDFENVNKMMKGLEGQLGVKFTDDEPQQGQQAVGQKQAGNSASSSQEDAAIKSDQQYSSLKDMICISAFVQEYKNAEKFVQNKKFPKLFEYFTEKRQKIRHNINLFNTKITTGQLKPEDYLKINVEPALASQEKLLKTASGNFAKNIELRIKLMKQEIGKIRLNANYIQTVFQNAFAVIGAASTAQVPQMTANQILAASQDQLSIPEKVKLISKFHKQNHNLALFYKANLPELQSVLLNFYIPTLQESVELIKQLQNGQNVSISSFLETKLLEITPEVFQKQDVQKFEANRSFYIDKLDIAIKSEFDLQKMIANQKKVAKVNQITDSSNLRIKQYEQAKSYLQKLSINQYILFPQITTKELKLDFSLDNKDIEKNQIIIMIKRLVDIKSEKYKISYSFTPEQQCLSYQSDWCNQSLVFNNTQKFTLQQQKYPQDLHKKKIDIILFQKGFFSDTEFARGSISLADLETNNTIDSTLILSHKGKHFSLEYGVYIRAPISSVGSKSIAVYEIKQYPQFNVNEGVEDSIKKNLENIVKQEVKPVQQVPVKQEVQPQQQQKQVNPPPAPVQKVEQPQQVKEEQKQQQEKQEEEVGFQGENLIADKFVYRDANSEDLKKIQAFDKIPEGLTLNELVDLENPSKYRSMPYLECGETMINNGIKAAEYNATQRRTINKIKTQFLEQKEILKIHIQNGKINPDEYQLLLKKLIDDDNKLISVYTSLGLPDWIDFVKARKQMIASDLKENFDETYDGKPYP